MDDKQWLHDCIVENFQNLVLLHLEGAPPAETIAYSVGAWLRAMSRWNIAWNEQLDKPRINEAFLLLSGQVQRWPSPAQLRAVLPARQYPQPALPAADYPAEKAKQNLTRIKRMIREAFK